MENRLKKRTILFENALNKQGDNTEQTPYRGEYLKNNQSESKAFWNDKPWVYGFLYFRVKFPLIHAKRNK
jgi:hypothetical protein